MWTVTRQCQYPDGDLVVEISSGGIDYTNPGQLTKKYDGEGDEYTDPREAVNAAIRIAEQWRKDKPEEVILIGRGATGGMTMPFDGEELTPETFDEYHKWANDAWEKVSKCDRCGDPLGKSWWRNDSDEYFCSEFCAEEAEKDNILPTCDECGEEMDKDCNGNARCAVCDDPCPCCSDGDGPE